MRNRILLAFVGGLAVAGLVFAAAGTRYNNDYARDRAEIDDLLSRYVFALDWQEPEQYSDLFTEDGVLVWAGGQINGRKAILEEVKQMRAADQKTNAATPGQAPFRRRHFASNFVLRIEGNRATVRTYWFEFNNDTADRRPYLGAYGHLEDELRRVDGRWLIARHQVFNEQRPNMVAGPTNPAW